ncbi:unnamed protein product [Didymodactylos carnosus]|uniref:FUZ/MON1/HPS1 third Longin domain-containing protein n=2 Tax=Didymodactylos carnosus TaxID=1234261 RepID=A0A813S2T0_9BILA|nr:unnamed protein product [Didymodactylos carnosus]CAF3573467.1 unnamed protein product [Didymodactylos carnosus]
MCLLQPSSYNIPVVYTEWKFVLLRTLITMIYGYDLIDQMSQSNIQRLIYEFNLVKPYVDLMLNDKTQTFGDLCQCNDTICGFERTQMFTCLKLITDQLKCDYVCITLSNRIIVSSPNWSKLKLNEQYVLQLLIAYNPEFKFIRDYAVYIESVDRTHNYRLITVRLIGHLHVSLLCSNEPKLNVFENTIETIFRPHIEYIQNISSLLYPRAIHDSVQFDHSILALLYINRQTHYCVSTLHPIPTTVTKQDIVEQRFLNLKLFYMQMISRTSETLIPHTEPLTTTVNEMYMINDDHKCYYLKENNYELFILYSNSIPNIALRGISRKTLTLLKKHL